MATLTQLRYAVAVERHRNFKRAAAACHVTQPTLSMQLQKLEDTLGVVLFDRSRKPVEPTANGTRLLEQFRSVLREVDRIDELIDELKGTLAGGYRLGIIPTMAPYILPRVVPSFARLYPDVRLHIEEITTDDIVRRLVDESLDAGILATPLDDRRITEFPICREHFVVYHAPGLELPIDPHGRVAVGDLPIERLIVMREGHCLRAQTLDLCAMGEVASREQGFVIEAGSMQTLCKMVAQGPFFTLLPAMAGLELVERGQDALIKEIADPVPYREIALVVRRTGTRRAIREALAEHARAAIEPLMDDGRTQRSAPVPPR